MWSSQRPAPTYGAGYEVPWLCMLYSPSNKKLTVQVIANRAIEMLGGKLGDKTVVHPQ